MSARYRGGVLSAEEVRNITLSAQAKGAYNETKNLSLKGWLFVILPITMVLVLILSFGVQEATGIQLYSLLNQPLDKNGQPIEELPGGRTKTLMARVLLGMIAVGAVGFLYAMWKKQGGAAGFLVGGVVGRTAALQLDKRAEQQLMADAQLQGQLVEEGDRALQQATLKRQQELARTLNNASSGGDIFTQRAAQAQAAVDANIAAFSQPPPFTQVNQNAAPQAQNPYAAPQTQNPYAAPQAQNPYAVAPQTSITPGSGIGGAPRSSAALYNTTFDV